MIHYGLVFLTTYTQCNVFDSSMLLHVSVSGFFLLLSTISVYGNTTFYFIQSPVGRHLGFLNPVFMFLHQILFFVSPANCLSPET